MTHQYLNARDYCPPALRVTRWWEPMYMRCTLFREWGETEARFCKRAEDLCDVWLATVTDLRHPFLITLECVYELLPPFDAAAADDLWLSKQTARAVIGRADTPSAVRIESIRLLNRLNQLAPAEVW